MDTRNKISRTCFSVSNDKIQIVTGRFDPLLPDHARKLRELKKPDHVLIVVITNGEKSLLPQQARAELVAALSVVDRVVLGADLPDNQIASNFIADVLCKTSAS